MRHVLAIFFVVCIACAWASGSDDYDDDATPSAAFWVAISVVGVLTIIVIGMIAWWCCCPTSYMLRGNNGSSNPLKGMLWGNPGIYEYLLHSYPCHRK